MDAFDSGDYTDHDSDYPCSSEGDSRIKDFDCDSDTSDISCMCALCSLEFAEPDYNLSDEFCVDQDSCDDFYTPQKLAKRSTTTR
jgi:hypothetical protein